jgi:RNA polymerase sigma-70 factor (ECF subfamily)
MPPIAAEPVRQLEHLARDYGIRAWRLAYALMGNVPDAEDVAQQAFCIAASKEEQIPADDPWPWFAAVTIKVARNARRKRGKHSDRFVALGDNDIYGDPEATDPADAVEVSELSEHLQAALDRLPYAYKEAVILTHVVGMSHTKAAETLGVPLGTLKAHVRRGVEDMRDNLRASQPSLVAHLAALPCLVPAGGLGLAVPGWIAGGRALAAETASKALWRYRMSGAKKGLTTTAFALLSGIALGFALSGGIRLFSGTDDENARAANAATAGRASARSTDGADADSGHSRSNRTATRRTRGASNWGSGRESEDSGTASRQPTKSPAAVPAVTPAPDAAASTVAKPAQPAPLKPTTELPIPYEGWSGYDALHGVDWSELGKAFNEFSGPMSRAMRAKSAGLPLERQTRAELALAGVEMERATLRAMARVTDALPTSSDGIHGEWTHPAIAANVMARQLELLDLPLSAAQKQEIMRQAQDYQTKWQQAVDGYTPQTSNVTKLVDEVQLKQDFLDAFYRTLTPEQADKLVAPEIRGVVGADPLAPASLVTGPSTQPITNDPNVPHSLRDNLMAMIAAQLQVPTSTFQGLEYLFDDWITETPGAGTPLPQGVVGLGAQQVIMAGNAQTRALNALLAMLPFDPMLASAVQSTTTIYLLQVVQSVPAPQQLPPISAPNPVPPVPAAPTQGSTMPGSVDPATNPQSPDPKEQNTGPQEPEGAVHSAPKDSQAAKESVPLWLQLVNG